MTYRSDRQIVEAVLPVKFLHDVILHGTDLSVAENKQVLDWLVLAGADAYQGTPPAKIDSLGRRVERVHTAAVADLRKGEAALAKVGLSIYYLLEQLRDAGCFQIVDGTPLDLAVTAMLGEEGSITEFANIHEMDRSAKKHAKRIFEVLQGQGFYREAEWLAG